ncbi:hypothetical protein [Ekhidna sp.]|uniref:hypothetical protein n=1 Tax=Ekhidna sp. TaxID=2608089 RepID=UPI003B5A3D0F
MSYQIPYFKYEFNNSTIDEKLFQYLKSNTTEQILSDFEKFKERTRSEFNKEWKTQKIVYEISLAVFLISLLGLFLTWESGSEITGFFAFMILPAFFGLFYAYSYGLSAGELRKAFNRRRKNLLKAHKAAQKSENFSQFLNAIRI